MGARPGMLLVSDWALVAPAEDSFELLPGKSCAAALVVKMINKTAKIALKMYLKRFTMQKYLIILDFPSFFSFFFNTFAL